ncbi:potassium channel family protein [Arcanobacterium hippocoleae]|uniref:Trk system potassium uptake protein TrkA n=1 Tax=Arcanobacterium hippocoleae TaxID=149017 RepID=A0ABU1T1W9_9ACTO|nr:TrkA family potassium uptake protein [Arcanobacterium hippocoleae]MDR6938850.1 trk system potassium uptake protein TrkA [Arcanobacterium hippocoleae]
MHFVIMGCGRVGAALALDLGEFGHSVAIIDKNPDAFRRLPENFAGQRVTGIGFDQDALRQAGIEDAAGFAAVSSGDNSNIIAARVVRDNFGIENVVTRIYDTSRANVYERLGIATVPTVKWTTESMIRKLIDFGPYTIFQDANYQISLFLADLHHSWYGISCAEIERLTNARIAYLGRAAKAIIPEANLVIQDGDELYLTAPTRQATAIQRILNHPLTQEAR